VWFLAVEDASKEFHSNRSSQFSNQNEFSHLTLSQDLMVMDIILLLLLLLSIGFVARIVASFFSPESARRLGARRLWHAVWFIAIPVFFILFLLPPSVWGPPVWWERGTQREKVLSRVKSAGGWETLRKECIQFAEQHKDEPIYYWNRETNRIPASIAALRPRRMEFYSAEMSKSLNDSGLPLIRIQVFGAHSTGGHDEPWMSLDVICGNPAKDYPPRQTAKMNGFWRYRKLADGVYECY
jgi:hypothetical protein